MTTKQKKIEQSLPVKAQGAFIKLNEDRIIKSGIKKYSPNKNATINVYFNLSLVKPEVRTYNFGTIVNQQAVLAYLDSIYL